MKILLLMQFFNKNWSYQTAPIQQDSFHHVPYYLKCTTLNFNSKYGVLMQTYSVGGISNCTPTVVLVGLESYVKHLLFMYSH